MQARFIGDPRRNGDGPASLSLYGMDFPKGQWVVIAEAWAPKLRGNSHFQVRADSAAAEPAIPAPAEPAGAEAVTADFNGSDPASFDHDHDGQTGGSLSKADVMARLDAMGVSYDARLGLPKLRGVLETALLERGED